MEDLEGGDYDFFPFVGLPLPAISCFDSLDFPFDQAYGDEALPAPTSFNLEDQLVQYEIDHTDEFAQAIEVAEERGKNYYSTKSFDDWCSNYFSSHCPPLEQLLANLGLHSVMQSAPMSKKTKGKHIDEILSFEKFYKVKWNVKWIRPTFHSALEVSERKKAAHEDQCFKNYLKAKTINPLVCRERFMKPFKYPPFPNAQFGIADRLPDPVKGSLSQDYVTNPLSQHLCGVTSTPYEWCREMDHLISGYTRIEGYPPGANPIIIIGTTSNPQKPVEQWESDEEKTPKKSKGKENTGRAKSSSTTILTSKKRNAIELASKAEGLTAKIARTSQPNKTKSKRVSTHQASSTMATRHEPFPESTAKSNMETAKEILANPAMINQSLSLGLAGMSSSQASTDSTKIFHLAFFCPKDYKLVDYTSLDHETNHVLISSSCPASASIATTTSSSLVPP
ncbi:hypothetical protein PIB30_070172 [Stylosanthes scabra]|uniref:Uncharacterized protein n=1 Tax=Stylosanthes scabra TaxID=79078 RepID=A0ABU6VLT1_9FABA|nr:hypothetical protein [Stylosanthes scabra]